MKKVQNNWERDWEEVGRCDEREGSEEEVQMKKNSGLRRLGRKLEKRKQEMRKV